MRKRREIAAFLAALLLFLLLSWGAGWLLRPNRTEFGSMWAAYLREPKNSVDVLFFGSSLVYCDIAPAWIWDESGLQSYVMAGPEQTIPLTYYYIREACRSQKPQTVMLEATGMFYQKYQNYTRANIGYMPLTGNRIAATFAAAEDGALEVKLRVFSPVEAEALAPAYATDLSALSSGGGERLDPESVEQVGEDEYELAFRLPSCAESGFLVIRAK